MPPGQNEVVPEVIVGVNAPTVMLALPFAVQLFAEATTLTVTGVAVFTVKVIDDVDCPLWSVPLVTVQV